MSAVTDFGTRNGLIITCNQDIPYPIFTSCDSLSKGLTGPARKAGSSVNED